MKKIITVVLFCLIGLYLYAQNAELAIDFSRYGTPITNPSYIDRSVVHDLIHELERVNRSKTPEELNEAFLNSIEGTPFQNNEFLNGKVLTIDDKNIDGVLLRYNIYNNKMEAKVNATLFELSENLVKRIIIEDRTFDYLPYQFAQKEDSGYLELIRDGESKLYCRHSKKFIDAQPQKAMQDKPSPAAFRDLPVVYLLQKNESSEVIGFRNKKELLSLFPTYKNEMQTFIKKNKLKHNRQDDLKKLLNYYDTL